MLHSALCRFAGHEFRSLRNSCPGHRTSQSPGRDVAGLRSVVLVERTHWRSHDDDHDTDSCSAARIVAEAGSNSCCMTSCTDAIKLIQSVRCLLPACRSVEVKQKTKTQDNASE